MRLILYRNIQDVANVSQHGPCKRLSAKWLSRHIWHMWSCLLCSVGGGRLLYLLVFMYLRFILAFKMMESSCILKKWFSKYVVRRETCSCAAQLCSLICRRLQLKCDGTRWRTGGEVKGKLANGVGSQYPSHYFGTWCIQHYYRWCAHLGCQQSTELTPPPI